MGSIQTATTGNLATAQNIALAKCRFVEEHNAPTVNLVTHLKLKKGDKQMTIPKVSTMTAYDLVDGVDLVSAQDIGLSSIDLTSDEVGLRVILSKKLLRQFNEDVFKIVGRQMGDAMARKKDTDLIALFASLNGGTALGADDKNMTMQNLAACISRGITAKIPTPYFIEHHPDAIYQYHASMTTPAQTYPMPEGFSAKLLKDWYFNSTMAPARVPIFHDGNITKISGSDSAYGVLASKDAMCIIEQLGYTTERDEDISLRAYEVVVTSDYGCFELDDSFGFPLRYEMVAPVTNN